MLHFFIDIKRLDEKTITKKNNKLKITTILVYYSCNSWKQIMGIHVFANSIEIFLGKHKIMIKSIFFHKQINFWYEKHSSLVVDHDYIYIYIYEQNLLLFSSSIGCTRMKIDSSMV